MKQITLLLGLLALCGTLQAQYTGGRLEDTRLNVSVGFFAPGGVGDYIGPVGVLGATGYTVDEVRPGDLLMDEVNLYRIDSVEIVTPESLATLHVSYLPGTVGGAQPPQGPRGAIVKPTEYLGLLLLTQNGSNLITEEQEAKMLTHNFLLIDSLLGNISLAASPDLDTINYLGNGQYEIIDEGRRDTLNTQADSNPIVNPVTIEGNTYPAITTSVQTILENLAEAINHVPDSIQLLDNGDGTYTSIIYGDTTTIYVRADSIPIVEPITVGDSTYAGGTSVEVILNALAEQYSDQHINEACAYGVNQVGHGFSVGDFLSQENNNGPYFLSSTSGPDSLPVAYVCQVISPDSFTVSSEGWIYGPHAYPPGKDYFVQDAPGVFDTIQDANYPVFAFRAYTNARYIDIPEFILSAGAVGSGSSSGDVTGFTYDGSALTIQTTSGNYSTTVNTSTMQTTDAITIDGIEYPAGTSVQTILEALAAPGADKNGIISELPQGNVAIDNSSNYDLSITQANGNEFTWDFGNDANGPNILLGDVDNNSNSVLNGSQLFFTDNGNSTLVENGEITMIRENGVTNPNQANYRSSDIRLIQANGAGDGNYAPRIALRQLGDSYPVFRFFNGEDTNQDQDLFDTNPLGVNRTIGALEYWGQNAAGDATTDAKNVKAAAIHASSREAFSTTNSGARLEFYTTPIGTTGMLPTMILEDNGRLRLPQYVNFSQSTPVSDFQMDNSGYLVKTPATLSGSVSQSTDAGGLITVTHNLGQVPAYADLSIESAVTAYYTTITNKTTTTVTFKVWDADGNAVASTGVTGGWLVR